MPTNQGARTTDGQAPRRLIRDYRETKGGFKTTEFIVTILFVAGVLIATYVDSDSLARADGWRYATFAVVAYVISRGLAKLGVREPYFEDIEDLRD